MKWAQSKKKAFTFLAVTALVISGAYNSVMVNSDSFMNEQDIRFVKRLDEVYGVVKVGRQFASTKTQWVKLSNKQVTEVAKNLVPSAAPTLQVAQASSAPATQVETAAAVQEELDLRLVEVANPKKYQGNVPSSMFSGNLVTADGRIETLSVSLPNGEGLSVNSTEMVGNVFEYDLDGETLSGMIYQVDQTTYMVTLTNGAFEGTRMKFSTGEAPAQLEQDFAPAQEVVAGTDVPVGQFGQVNGMAVEGNPDAAMQAQAMEYVEGQAAPQAFNFDASQAI